jgi:hypothetical protein
VLNISLQPLILVNQEIIAAKKVFKNSGSLTEYLLLVNLVYAGVVPPPSVEEVGQLIFSIKRGSFNKVVVLGPLNANTGQEECGWAYARLVVEV